MPAPFHQLLANLVFTGLVAAWVYGKGLLENLRDRRAQVSIGRWREAAQAAGLTGIDSEPAALVARSGAFLVRLGEYRDKEVVGTRVELRGPRLAPGLTLRLESESWAPDAALKEIRLGDEEFDRLVSVQGTPGVAHAVLDADMRRTVRDLLHGALAVPGRAPLRVSGRLVDGVLRIDLPERAAAVLVPGSARRTFDADQLPALLRSASDLAARFSVPTELAPRIASNMAHEVDARVRRRALLTLLRDFPDGEATQQALQAAREDSDAEVRVRAGLALGPAGRDVVMAALRDERLADPVGALAVGALVGMLARGEATDVLKGALRTRRLQTATRCLELLGAHGEAAVPILSSVMLVEIGDLAAAAASALAATGSLSAEAPLLRGLAEGPTERRHAAAAALGRIGTRDAVQALRKTEASSPELRGVARQAIAEIQSRLAGAAQGQLSLAGGEAGQLSIADDDAGRLSIVVEQRVDKPAPS